MPDAYSYIRFSSKRQVDGDSIRRQETARDEWLARHAHLGLRLVQSYRDLGVSAYRGKNSAVGELRRFLELVQSGRIARGSYLIIEHLDRLTRDDVTPAIHQLTGLTLAGINVVTLVDGRIYSNDRSSPDQTTNLMMAIIYMAKSGEESDKKHYRQTAVWANKREVAVSTRKPITKTCPAWIDVTDEGKFVLNRHADTVRQIYRWSADGHGSTAVLRKLVAGNYEPMATGKRVDGTGWNVAYVRLVLSNRAVIGDLELGRRNDEGRRVLTGEVAVGYYPAAVNHELWSRAQAAQLGRRSLSVKRRAAGTVGGPNIFAGLLKCASCGGPMVVRFVHHQPHLRYTRCHNAYNTRTCPARVHYPLHKLEPILLDRVESYLASALSSEVTESIQTDSRLSIVKTDLERETNRLARLLASFGDDDDAAVMDAIVKKKTTVAELRAEKAKLEAERLRETTALPHADQLANVRRLRSAMDHGEPQEAADARAKLSVALQQMINGLAFDHTDKTIVMIMLKGRGHFGFQANALAWERQTHIDHWYFTPESKAKSWEPLLAKDVEPKLLRHIMAACSRANEAFGIDYSPKPLRQAAE